MDLRGLATSTVYRRRMTYVSIWSRHRFMGLIHLLRFVACLQALVTPSNQGLPEIPLDDDFWKSVSDLADDTVVGVRIGVARLLGFVSGSISQDHDIQHSTQNLPGILRSSSGPSSGFIWDIVRRLSQDNSYEVRSYIPSQLDGFNAHMGHAIGARTKSRMSNISTFSRPPPTWRSRADGRQYLLES